MRSSEKGYSGRSQNQERTVQVIVTDRGPAKCLYRQGRILDLSKAAFAKLAPLSQGVIQVEITPLAP